MKILVENYTFNSATKQIALTDYTSVNLESFLLITNVTDNIIIYNFADPAKGGTVAGNVLTLDFDTTGMSNTDSLQVFIDNYSKPASDENLDYLKILANQTKTLATQDTAQRQRVVVEGTLPNIAGTVTVNDVASQNAFARGADAFARQFALPDVWNTMELARINYQSSIRSKLIF